MSVNSSINHEALKSEIRSAIINGKANACPITLRLAWHAAGTFDKRDNSGGSDGATMRFDPESTDPANAGLSIVQDLLKPVKAAHPEISFADLWTFASCSALEFIGGPKVPHEFCRSDVPHGAKCPPNGRLPDASKGAEHLREVFGRMGFDDREIVCLSGAHTLGRCHRVRSGYDGPWTRNPLKFDNHYFKNLIYMEWTPKKWDGPLQYEDPSGDLMMLPTDLCLVQDPKFRVFVEMYAKDEALFFKDFAAAYGKLIALGTTPKPVEPPTPQQIASAELREAAMHGSVDVVKRLASKADIHERELSSGRNAMHKAAFWGHFQTIDFLVKAGVDPNVQDYNGDTALHDAARFGHISVVEILLPITNLTLKNALGQTVAEVAVQYSQDKVLAVLKGANSKL